MIENIFHVVQKYFEKVWKADKPFELCLVRINGEMQYVAIFRYYQSEPRLEWTDEDEQHWQEKTDYRELR